MGQFRFKKRINDDSTKHTNARSEKERYIIKISPEFDTMIVRYSPVIFDVNPSKNPLGLVVVNPTRMCSAMVERHDPRKSYFIIELGRRFTPISVEK